MELDFQFEEVSEDDVLLISGPSMSGKYELLLKILTQYADGLIVITTKHHADRLREDLTTAVTGEFTRLGIIACGEPDSRSEAADAADTTVKFVSSPQNLTNIGVKFTELVDEYLSDPDISHVGVGIHSVTSLIMHSDIRPVFQFLQVMTGQIRSAGWLGIAVVDTELGLEDEVIMLQHHFDGVIETRESEDGSREFRTRGLAPKASEWRVF